MGKRDKTDINFRASNDWSRDNDKFGQRMLEKMGWKKGQGLGSRNQGIHESVKCRLKFDSKGFGYKENDNGFLQLGSNYTNLFSELKINNKTTNVKPSVSLEERSQSSKSRLHYAKFARSKDLSLYKDKDLTSIFGCPLGKMHNEDLITVDRPNDEENYADNESTVSILQENDDDDHDSSSRKWKKSKSRNITGETKTDSSKNIDLINDPSITEENDTEFANRIENYDDFNENTREKPAKKRKKKSENGRRKREITIDDDNIGKIDDDNIEKIDNVVKSEIDNNDNNNVAEPKRKRKKKCVETVFDDENAIMNVDDTESNNDHRIADENDDLCSSTITSSKTAKKKYRKSKVFASFGDDGTAAEDMISITNSPEQILPTTMDNNNLKSTTRKKRKILTDCAIINDVDETISEYHPSNVVCNKKRKKKCKDSSEHENIPNIPANIENGHQLTGDSVERRHEIDVTNKEIALTNHDNDADHDDKGQPAAIDVIQSTDARSIIEQFESHANQMLVHYSDKLNRKTQEKYEKSAIVDKLERRATELRLKKELLEKIKNNSVTVNFVGSNITDIKGYGVIDEPGK